MKEHLTLIDTKPYCSVSLQGCPVDAPAWIRQLCSSPPAQVHTLSLSREAVVFSPSSGPKQQQLCSLPAHPESHYAPTSGLCISTPPAPSLGCSTVVWLLSLSYCFDLSALEQWISKQRELKEELEYGANWTALQYSFNRKYAALLVWNLWL